MHHIYFQVGKLCICVDTSFRQWRSQYRGKGAECTPWQWKNCQKLWKRVKKSGKIGKKRGKSGRKGKNWEGSFTLPLLKDGAGYTTVSRLKNCVWVIQTFADRSSKLMCTPLHIPYSKNVCIRDAPFDFQGVWKLGLGKKITTKGGEVFVFLFWGRVEIFLRCLRERSFIFYSSG